MINKSHFILYVLDQNRSASFYSKVLNKTPELDVPGMTEFNLSQGSILGLMPESGIRKLLSDALFLSPDGTKTPRAEIYLVVSNAEEMHKRAIDAGAIELSAPQLRDWGHYVGYSLDPDNHVIAFAEIIKH
jgi:uncharacterized protein